MRLKSQCLTDEDRKIRRPTPCSAPWEQQQNTTPEFLVSFDLTTGTFFQSENSLAVFKIKDRVRGRKRESIFTSMQTFFLKKKKKSFYSLDWFGYKKVRDGSVGEVKVENWGENYILHTRVLSWVFQMPPKISLLFHLLFPLPLLSFSSPQSKILWYLFAGKEQL